jgi:flagellar biosynthesis protein FlhG
MGSNGSRLKLWSVGGGKGGVGKSLVTLGLGIALSRLGNRVILIDGDLGGANLHTLMGIGHPEVSLGHFLNKKLARLEDTIIATGIEGIGLICGADDLLGGANPTYTQKIRLLDQIEELPADYVLMDLGAGTSFNTLDFFNYSRGKIAVFTSQPPALQNAYGFIKSALYRKVSRDFARDNEVLQLIFEVDRAGKFHNIQSMHDFLKHFENNHSGTYEKLMELLSEYHLFLMINMVKNNNDLRYVDIISSLCEDFLHINPGIIGYVPFDPGIEPALRQEIPWRFSYHKESPALAELNQTALRLVSESRVQ